MPSRTASLHWTTASPVSVRRARPDDRSRSSRSSVRSSDRSRMLAAGWLMWCAPAA